MVLLAVRLMYVPLVAGTPFRRRPDRSYHSALVSSVTLGFEMPVELVLKVIVTSYISVADSVVPSA